MTNFSSVYDLSHDLLNVLFGGDADLSAIEDAVSDMDLSFPVEKGSVGYEAAQRIVWAKISNGAEFPFNKVGYQPLFVVTIGGGDASILRYDATVWMNLEGKNWQALCTVEQAEDVASLAGGVEVDREEWDGSKFGDGNCGTVSSPFPGIIDMGTSGADAPLGWGGLDSDFSVLAVVVSRFSVDEQEAKIQVLADALTDDDGDKQEFVEHLRESMNIIQAA